jgi:hypothetical protein
MDKDQEVYRRNVFLGRHSGCTYIHSMCGGFHIQAHMVARTRQSHKRVQRGGDHKYPQRPDTYRAGFHCCMVNSAECDHFVYSTDFLCPSHILKI